MMDTIKALLIEILEILTKGKHAGYVTAAFPCLLDEKLESLVVAFRNARELDSSTWQEIRESITAELSKCLQAFAHRMAEIAVEQSSLAKIQIGLIALALDSGKYDLREVMMIFPLLYRAAELTGNDPSKLFQWASTYAVGDAVKVFQSFPHRAPTERSLSSMGFYETTSEGVLRFQMI